MKDIKVSNIYFQDSNHRAQRQQLDEGQFLLEPLSDTDSEGFLNNYKVVSLTDLMNIRKYRISKSKLELMLIRVVTRKRKEELKKFGGYARIYDRKNNTGTEANFNRLFLFWDINSPTGEVVYLFEGNGENEILWTNEYRDNGVISIGTIITLVRPKPISGYLGNEIPITRSDFTSVVMKTPTRLPRVIVDTRIREEVTRAFCLNEVKIDIYDSCAKNTDCAGLFCDRQNIREVKKSVRTCGCYSYGTRKNRISLVHSLQVTDESFHISFDVDEFSSCRFDKLFLSKDFSYTTDADRLSNGTDSDFAELESCIQSIVEFINDNEGFTVVGWYKRGTIVDQIEEGDKNESKEKKGASNLVFHIVSLQPTNQALDFSHLQFDGSQIV